jgi:hypothetical protein
MGRFSKLISNISQHNQHLKFSWIIPNQLGIGPAPLTADHWKTLNQVGFLSRFSCCYPSEEEGLSRPDFPIMEGRVAFPDHRNQETLSKPRLLEAIQVSMELMTQAQPLYLHCWAGQKRSALLAIAHVSLLQQISVLNAMILVKEAHPPTNPVYEHLELLNEIISCDGLVRKLSSQPTLYSAS